MSIKYVIDTSAWIEYFLGSPKGDKVKPFIEEDGIATPMLVIAELNDKYIREGKEFEQSLKFIKERSSIIQLTLEIALKSGHIKLERRKREKDFGLADAIVLATARMKKSRLLTTDPHFKGLEDVEFIE